jgi:GTPase
MNEVYQFNWAIPIGSLPQEPKEDDKGITEYKLHLVTLDDGKVRKRASQMEFRLRESGGKLAFYQIGLSDDGTPNGISKENMLESLGYLFILIVVLSVV